MPIDIEITDLRQNSLHSVLRIERQSFLDPWSLEIFIGCLIHEHLFWGAYYKESLAGYMTACVESGGFHITNLAVDRLFRRQGISHRLLQKLEVKAIEEGFAEISLEVRKSNHWAIHLYKSEGYVQVGVNHYYYSDGEDALIFSKQIETKQQV